MKNFVKLAVSILICEGAGILGSVFTAPSIPTWYAGLVKPTFNPPSWVFAPVWTALYALMGIALFLVWKNHWQVSHELIAGRDRAWNRWSEKFWRGSWQKQNAIAVFAVQLILNVFWSVVFFGWHMPGLAFFVIIALWVAIVYTIVNFYRISKPASWLLAPYLLWVTFASVLNFALWRLNS